MMSFDGWVWLARITYLQCLLVLSCGLVAPNSRRPMLDPKKPQVRRTRAHVYAYKIRISWGAKDVPVSNLNTARERVRGGR